MPKQSTDKFDPPNYDMRQPVAEPKPQQKMVECVVARGRSVATLDPTRMIVAGWDADTGKPIMRASLRTYGPGEQLQLPEDEVIRLRGTGHLHDPDKVIAMDAAHEIGGIPGAPSSGRPFSG
jgi:hypothetical protein